MNRREMVDELIERLEAELDELNSKQLELLIIEYEHSPILNEIIDSLDVDEEDEEESDDDEELPLIDGDWEQKELEDEE